MEKILTCSASKAANIAKAKAAENRRGWPAAAGRTDAPGFPRSLRQYCSDTQNRN
jgi:hypothetical protein